MTRRGDGIGPQGVGLPVLFRGLVGTLTKNEMCVKHPRMELTDEQAETIVLYAMLNGLTDVQAAVQLGHVAAHSSRYPGDLGSWENTLKILQVRKRLEEITNKAHSEHTKE